MNAELEYSEQKKPRFERHCLLFILALALATRAAPLGVTWRSDSAAAPMSSDSATYLAPALSLATEGTFKTNRQLEIFRTPGYPAFLVACAFTGRWGYGIAQIVQVLLDVFLVYLTYMLGARLVSRAAGLWASALQACSVLAITSSTKILSDGLFSLLITIAMLCVVRHIRIGGLQPLALGAAATAAATYVRPVGFIFVPIVALVLLFRPRRPASLASFVVIFVALVTPWFVRNYMAAGYVGFSSFGDYSLLFTEGAGVWAKSHGLSTLQAREQLDRMYRQRLLVEAIEPGSAQAIRVERQMGKAILFTYPGTFLRVHVSTSLNCLLPAGTGLLEMLGVTAGNRGTLSVLQTAGLWPAIKYYFGSNFIAIALIVPDLIFLAIQYLAASTYAFRQLGSRGLSWGPAAWLVVLTILAFVMVAGPGAVPRFRLPVEPLINVAAGAGVAMLLNHRKLIKEGSSLAKPAWAA